MNTKTYSKDSTPVIAALVLILFGAIMSFPQTPSLRGNGKIAFTSDRDGNREIYVMNVDGSSQVRLTDNNIVDDHPTWSPDGKKIAFLSQNVSGAFAIFVMNSDGTGKTEVTTVNYQLRSPWNGFDIWMMSWSPDGTQIIFPNVNLNTSTLFIVNADGSNRHNLTTGFYPAWSPDGSKILFMKSDGGISYTLHTILPDGSALQNITPAPLPSFYSVWDSPPMWSSDGQKIAFSATDFANSEIYIANTDGSNAESTVHICAELVPEGCGFNTAYPTWSPNGKTIALAIYGNQSGSEIYTMNIESGARNRLTNTSGQNSNPSWQSVTKAVFDFDGDGRSDISVFRPSDRVWYLNRSTDGFSATQFGLGSDKLTPADYDGDGKTDLAVFRDGVWYWLASSNGTASISQFGLTDDVPVPADYSGDGRADLAIYRSGTWWSLNLSNNEVSTVQFGLSTDKPVASDYDGDGRADQAVYRAGEWHLNRSTQGYAVVDFGLATDKPVPADYDGDGKTDLTVYRDGTWYLLGSQAGFAQFQWGIATDIPVPADYDGDGKTDAAVFRAGAWYLRQSTNGIAVQQFGVANDRPVAASYPQ